MSLLFYDVDKDPVTWTIALPYGITISMIRDVHMYVCHVIYAQRLAGDPSVAETRTTSTHPHTHTHTQSRRREKKHGKNFMYSISSLVSAVHMRVSDKKMTLSIYC